MARAETAEQVRIEAARFAGVDVGSLSAEAVIVDGEGRPLASSIVLTGARSRVAAEAALLEALGRAGLERSALGAVIATGYGRGQVEGADRTVTEVTCHARGIRSVFPQARLLLDVGGQDSKAVRLDEAGRVIEFAMNDKCAAGTGRFFEVMARALEVDLDALGPLALRAGKRLAISHACTVFAESEVVGLVAAGAHPEDIAWALCHSAADRVATLAARVGVIEPVALSGGVALNSGFVAALESLLGVTLLVPDEPQIVGALGAALLAAEL